jgi:hypothetical protein
MSFRSAVSADPNFVWCQKCDFGQLHSSGESQPIIRCLNCNFRSCFKHAVEWHERLTCDEYDEYLADPDGFQSAVDKDDEAAELLRAKQEENESLVLRLGEERERRAEENRQRQVHVTQLQRAKVEQAAEAAETERNRREQEAAEAMARKIREVEAARELEKRNEKQMSMLERFRKAQADRELVKRRQKEEKMSLEKVEATTKQCPGCQWPIEKNEGCSHMTCKNPHLPTVIPIPNPTTVSPLPRLYKKHVLACDSTV